MHARHMLQYLEVNSFMYVFFQGQSLDPSFFPETKEQVC